MRLLIVTQKVDKNDPILGFFVRWIEEFAKYFESIIVITLEEGDHELPTNVRVLSLGKGEGNSKFSITRRFFKLIRDERQNYDAVFVHMNPIYIALAGWRWKWWHKKVFLWYTHKQVDAKLKIAYRYVERVFTASEESFKLPGSKTMVTGHGIDVVKFASIPRTKALGAEPVKIIDVGRITLIKDPVTMIEATRTLRDITQTMFKVVFVGGPVTLEDKDYALYVSDKVKKYALYNLVTFMGDLAPNVMMDQYHDADIAVNLTPTGGLDKAVLEAMAAGIPVITSNEAFRMYFGEYAKRLIFKHGDSNDLANKLKDLIETKDLDVIGSNLQSVVRDRADVSELIRKITDKIYLDADKKK